MKVLVTGSRGFVGTHLVRELRDNHWSVVSADLKADGNTVFLDIKDREGIYQLLSKEKPDVVVNLAGQANVGASWNHPQQTVELNTIGFLNILDAVKRYSPTIKIIGIGSSDEYGILKEKGINVTEDIGLNPITPYAISKHCQEQFASLYCHSFGMNISMIRLFNLGGAKQAKGFMISDFASGIAEIEANRKDFLSVGNLEAARDFVHVKDACRAIRLISEKGRSGEVYNVCSGKVFTAKEILEKLIKMAKCEIRVEKDPARFRPSDTPIICGNHDKLTEQTGWNPQYTMDDILLDAITYWRSSVQAGNTD